MPKGYFRTWSDELMREFGSELLAAAEQGARSAGGWRVHTARLGHTVIAFRSIDARVHALLSRTMVHLATDESPELVISVCDSASTGVARPAEPGWAVDTWRHEGEATVLFQERHRDLLEWTDAERGVGLWWIPDEASIPAWDRPAPLRAIIDRLLSPRGVTLAHAGIVGDERGAVMLTGPSGSGKSSSVVACVAGGMKSGGDDFVLVHDHERHPTIGWSMFATARLLPDSPAWSTFVPQANAIELPRRTCDDDDPNVGKHTVFLNEQFPNSVDRSFRIRALAVPIVAERKNTVVAPMRPSTALLALAPSSMLQLVDPHRSAFARLGALVREVPCYALHVGEVLTDIPRAVGELLDDAGAQ